MANNGKKDLGLSSHIHPKVWAVANELNNRIDALEKKTGSKQQIAKLTALDMKWITKFLESGDPYVATEQTFRRDMTTWAKNSITAQRQEKPAVQRVIGEIMKEDEKFADDKIMSKAAELYYNPESESTSVQMFGHIAKIKGWNAPEKAVNVNINKDLGGATDAELLETLDTIIAGEEGSSQGEPIRPATTGDELTDELTAGD